MSTARVLPFLAAFLVRECDFALNGHATVFLRTGGAQATLNLVDRAPVSSGCAVFRFGQRYSAITPLPAQLRCWACYAKIQLPRAAHCSVETWGSLHAGKGGETKHGAKTREDRTTSGKIPPLYHALSPSQLESAVWTTPRSRPQMQESVYHEVLMPVKNFLQFISHLGGAYNMRLPSTGKWEVHRIPQGRRGALPMFFE